MSHYTPATRPLDMKMMTREYVDNPAARELAVCQHGNRLIKVRVRNVRSWCVEGVPEGDRLVSLSIVQARKTSSDSDWIIWNGDWWRSFGSVRLLKKWDSQDVDVEHGRDGEKRQEILWFAEQTWRVGMWRLVAVARVELLCRAYLLSPISIGEGREARKKG